MLVLSRRVGQKIRIGSSIVVTLLKVDRNRARIGVEAPVDVPVYRQELFEFLRERRAGAVIGQPDPRCAGLRNRPPRVGPVGGLSTTRSLWGGAAV